MTISLRPYESADWPGVWALLEPVFRAGETYAVARDVSEDEARRAWVESPAVAFVAHDGDEVVGTYYLKPNHPGAGAHVCNAGFVVAARASGRGVATAMCEHAQEQAFAREYRAMQFNLVAASNREAVRLWQKLGFKIVATLEGAFHHPTQGFVDAYVMYKKLSALPPHADRARVEPALVTRGLGRADAARRREVWLVEPREPGGDFETLAEELGFDLLGALPHTHVDQRRRLVLILEAVDGDAKQLETATWVRGCLRETWQPDAYPYDDPTFAPIRHVPAHAAWYRSAGELPPWPQAGRPAALRRHEPARPRLSLTLPAAPQLDLPELVLPQKFLIVADLEADSRWPIQDRNSQALHGDLSKLRRAAPERARTGAIWAGLQQLVDHVGERAQLRLLHALEWEAARELSDEPAHESGLRWHTATAYSWGDEPFVAVVADDWRTEAGQRALEVCARNHAAVYVAAQQQFVRPVARALHALELYGLTLDPYGPERARQEQALADRVLCHLALLGARSGWQTPSETEQGFRDWLTSQTEGAASQLDGFEVTVDSRWVIELSVRLRAPSDELPLSVQRTSPLLRRA